MAGSFLTGHVRHKTRVVIFYDRMQRSLWKRWKGFSIKPSRPDPWPSIIIIVTSSITCHPGSQYWRYILLPRTSLSLPFPPLGLFVFRRPTEEAPLSCARRAPFSPYCVTWSCVLPTPGSRADQGHRRLTHWQRSLSGTFTALHCNPPPPPLQMHS